ncbi:MAG: winged helix-turn-helix domain-containing protein [Candidatus Kerfeldbacteria bacterium]
MIEKIFGSRTRLKLLRLFLTNADEHYFVRELARKTGEQINSVRRELKNLEDIGLLQSYEENKKKFYHVDKEYVLFNELRALIFKSRMTLETEFIQSIRGLGPIHYLALCGYFVNDAIMQVDLFIVGNVSRTRLDKLLEKFNTDFGRQLRFTILSADEYSYRKDVTDKFLYEFLNAEKIVVIDKLKPRS